MNDEAVLCNLWVCICVRVWFPVLRLTALGEDMKDQLTFINPMNTGDTHTDVHTDTHTRNNAGTQTRACTHTQVDGPQRSIEQREAQGS